MTLHVFLLLFLLIFCLARLCQLHWLHHSPPHSRAVAVRTTVQRLLKPRSPLDCPACRLHPLVGCGASASLCAALTRSQKPAGSP